MALEAAAREQGANLSLEELKRLGGGGRVGSKPGTEDEQGCNIEADGDSIAGHPGRTSR
jgi:hypothetical protein